MLAYSVAVKTAKMLSNKKGKGYYVVYVPQEETGPYDVCSYFDLHTFYDGLSEENIFYCTEDES